MTDPIKQIRYALEVGPTPGPWTVLPGDGDMDHKAKFASGASVLVMSNDDCDRHPVADASCNHTCRALWDQEANAAYIAACNPAAITELLARLDAAELDAAKSERRARMFSGIVHDHTLAMQAAVIAYEIDGPCIGMTWIANTLAGPGHYPDVEAAKAMGGAQAYFDAETEKEEKRLEAIDDARLAQGVKP